ncbi:class I SAM-dependent methyltransferase [Ancylobacter mangrovi]|uniref:class I SAM-dependent methyltransferase n=1 Tax=Ancylobacter mangrovi TaxID=2972472 RepID=UPI002162D4AD|nr:class I SAM-dependent methyltransferase [Ancylobacter mangrovi]MCS0503072.1 class I SAM-dependent methyltransferase [Ancylobacter mangrovi]
MADDAGERQPAPMEAGGRYNDHSHHQATGGAFGLPMIAPAFASMAPSGPVVLADYGCAQGRNSLRPLAEALARTRALIGAEPAISVVHVDQPANDFAALFLLLRDDGESYLRADANVFASAVGRSHFDQVLPSGSVDFGWSSFAAHWLSAAPVTDAGHVWPHLADPAVEQRFAAQAAEDWRRFLASRARELKPGGALVVVQPCLGEGVATTFPVLMDWTQQALEAMEREGMLTTAERRRMTLLVYERRLDELRAPFASGAFAGLEMVAEEARPMPDPFWPAYRADSDAEALAGRHLGFFRAPFMPSLIAALDPARDAAFRTAFAARLESELHARMLAAPQPLLEPMTIHSALLRKVG